MNPKFRCGDERERVPKGLVSRAENAKMFKAISAGAKRRPLPGGEPYRNRAMIADVFGQLCNTATGNFERRINRRARSLPAVGADGHECKRLVDAHPSQANGPREVAAGIGGQDDLPGGYEPATANAVRASTLEGKKRPLRVIPAMFGSWVRSSLNRQSPRITMQSRWL
jgi:hypothetical protein